MTRVSYNIISSVGNTTLYTGIKSYPQAAVIYTPVEIKDETRAKNRLVAHLA